MSENQVCDHKDHDQEPGDGGIVTLRLHILEVVLGAEGTTWSSTDELIETLRRIEEWVLGEGDEEDADSQPVN